MGPEGFANHQIRHCEQQFVYVVPATVSPPVELPGTHCGMHPCQAAGYRPVSDLCVDKETCAKINEGHLSRLIQFLANVPWVDVSVHNAGCV